MSKENELVNLNKSGSSHNVSNSQSSKNKELSLLDQIINKYGYGSKTILQIINSVFFSLISSFIIYHVSTYNVFLSKWFNSSHDSLLVVSCFTIAIKSIGCLFTGYFTEKWGRKNCVFFILSVVLFLHILFNIFTNLVLYCIFLFISSFFTAILDPIAIDVLMEKLPLKFRSFFLCFYASGFTLNILIQYVLLWALNGNLKWIYLVNSIIILLIGIYNYFFFEDSPRFLIIRNETEKALKVIEEYNNGPLTEEEKDRILKEVSCGSDSIEEVSLKEIFKGTYLFKTISFSLMIFLSISNYNGLTYVLNFLIIERIPGADVKTVSQTATIINIFICTSYIIGGILAEVPSFGRRYTLIILGSIIGIASLMYLLVTTYFDVWLSILFICNEAYLSISIGYSGESYPTKIRDTSQGFFISVLNIGGLIGFLSYKLLFNVGGSKILLIIALIDSVILVGLLFTGLRETHSQALDRKEEKSESEGKENDEELDLLKQE